MVLLYHQLPNPFQLALATVDLIQLSFFIWKTVREILFMIHNLQLSSFIAKRHINELMATLKQATLTKGAKLSVFRYRHLHYFYSEFSHLLRYGTVVNELVVSWMLLVTLLTNLVCNVFTVGRLVFDKSPLLLSEQLVLLVFLLMQWLLGVTACSGMINWSNAFTRSERLLYRVQMSLVSGNDEDASQGGRPYKMAVLFRTKMKLAAFYERVCKRDDFRFTVGSLAKIDNKSMFEFSLFYSGLIMFVGKSMRKGRI